MNTILNTYRVVAAYPAIEVGNPKVNVEEIITTFQVLKKQHQPDVILFPELSLTGYTCGELFHQSVLLESAKKTLLYLAQHVYEEIVVVGLPVVVDNAVYNCAAILNTKKIIGIIPKTYLPNYREFYEKRWFSPAPAQGQTLTDFCYYNIPFGTDLLFEDKNGLKIGVEICEDLWAPIPPSSYQALAGANLLLNLSASNEIVAKSEYRRELVKNQSARCMAAYVYCGAGPTESTSDLTFAGHCLAVENGSILGETKRFKPEDHLLVDVDVEKLRNERRRTNTFQDNKDRIYVPAFKTIKIVTKTNENDTLRVESKFPFVPNDPATLHERCWDIFNIQTNSLIKRLSRVSGNLTIGISGGLDSTLSLLVAVKACKMIGKSPKKIDAVTLPGFGTSDHTLDNANKLMDYLGVSKTAIDIRQHCLNTFKEIGHKPFGIDPNMSLEEFEQELQKLPDGSQDTVFENVQARVRTMLLMSRGFVLGTGDLSELAIGWCTYNGDHMSMYNVNASVPKTLVKFLVDWVADNECRELVRWPGWDVFEDDAGEALNHLAAKLQETLKSIVNTQISPELLPLKDGKSQHSTEEIVGPYPLLDYFLFHFVRNNFSPSKIYILAQKSFPEYTSDQIKAWLKDFLKRFFNNQFKRDAVPNGPKVGTVSLSPRGDWKMPSDADASIWIEDLDQ
ncbi:MAG: NAD(+) synthase [Crenarchaeota archaeon]|nr:MAG: NAD(+) synthase [Thermoproteota archaeon]